VRALRAGGWLLAVQVVTAFVGLIQKIVLARLIAPEDFGLMGLALLTTCAAEVLSSPDLASALIQKKGDVRDYLNSLWTCQLIRAVLIFVVLILGAPAIALFFRCPFSTHVIRLVALGILLRGLQNPGFVLFRKDIQFRPRFIVATSASLFGTVVSIIYALVWRNVWALVAGTLVSAAVSCLLSYALHPYRPTFDFSRDRIMEMFRFGGWVWASGILVFFVTQGDDLFVSRVLGTTMLAYYQMAYWLANLPATQFSRVLSQITFPVYSSLQDSAETLRSAFLKTFQATLMVAVPFAFVCLVLAEPLTVTLLGDKWKPIIPALKVLSVAGLARSASSTMGPVFLALGKPRVTTLGQILRLTVLGVSIVYLTVRLGIQGTSISVLLCGITSFSFFLTVLVITLRLPILRCLKAMLPPVTGGLALMVLLMCLQTFLECGHGLSLSLSLLLGVAVYIGAVGLCDAIWKCGSAEIMQRVIRLGY